jgi:predicted GNAT superfamily acetyltransferase
VIDAAQSREAIPIEAIASQTAQVQAELLALNNIHAMQTTLLDSAAWRHLLDDAFVATCIGGAGGLMIALDQTADYSSANFRWFRDRLPRFAYVDRIVIASAMQGRGAGRALYEDLFIRARAAGHDRVVCEVNVVPANPHSLAFHAKLGFRNLEQGSPYGNGKIVQYMSRSI